MSRVLDLVAVFVCEVFAAMFAKAVRSNQGEFALCVVGMRHAFLPDIPFLYGRI
jgi:hypothetical protein